MDRDLRTAWRDATASPDDGKKRLAFAIALLRSGHRVAAAHEARAAARSGVAVPEDVRRELVVGTDLIATDGGGVAAIVDDARFPRAFVVDGEKRRPVVFAHAPSCSWCEGRGTLECAACGGSGGQDEGMVFYRITLCDDCVGTGRLACQVCNSLGVRIGAASVASTCSHVIDVEENTLRLARCTSCGLAACLGESTTWACDGCGWFHEGACPPRSL